MAMDSMKFWIITPSGATNLVTNPTPYRATTGYAAVTGSIAASDTYTRRGPKSIQVTPTTAASGISFGTVSITDTGTYVFSVDVKGEAGKPMRIKVEDAGGTYSYATTFTATGDWERQEVGFTAEETASDYSLYVLRDATTGTNVFYVDGFQFETGLVATTFFSGDTEGFTDNDFYWNGTPHASTSTRSADTRAGGALLDISDYAKVIAGYGLGMGNYIQVYNELVSGGALYQKHIRKPRNFSLMLSYDDSTQGGLQAKRNTIIEACSPDGDTPMVIRYQGLDGTDQATQPLDIICIPQTSHTDTPDNPIEQKDTLTFTVLDGYLTGAYKEGIELAASDTLADADYFVMRDADGLWSVPNNAGTGIAGIVYVIAEAANGDIYIGGDFVNAGGIPEADYICKWDGSAITAVVAGCNAVVRSLCFDAAGNLYVGGNFTDWGDANGDYIVKWDGSSLSSLGTGMGSSVYALAIDPATGYLYAGGAFLSAGGVADTAYFAYWDGSAWQSAGVVVNTVFAATYSTSGILYIGGMFNSAGGVADTTRIASYDGTTWRALGTGANGTVSALASSKNGDIYASGSFTTAGAVSASYIAKWDGGAWSALGEGLEDSGLGMHVSSNGTLYVAGAFTAAGGLVLSDRIAVWSNGAWGLLDADLPGTDAILSVFVSSKDELYIGGEFTGSGIANDQKTVTNSGNTNVYPVIEITGPGVLQGFSNYTTGASIQFDGLTLQAGEIITMKLDPVNLKMTSNWRGNVLRYVNAGSDLGDFYLKPGANSITFFMPSGTTAATKAYLYYTPAFWNIEGALL